MSKPIVLDTNVLIDNPQSALNYEHVILPYQVLIELDNHKRNYELNRQAREAIKCINYALHRGSLEVVDLPTAGDTPDEKIVDAAKRYDAEFVTQDIGAKVIAKAHGVELGDEDEVEDFIDESYTGYVELDISNDVDYEMHWKHLREAMPAEIEDKFKVVLKTNQYLILNRTGGAIDIWKQSDDRVVRISQSSKPLRDAGIVDSPLDSVQQAALDAIMDNTVPLTVIDGKIGGGKSILSLMGALACVRGQKRYQYYNEILVTRPPIAIDRKMEIGFLPGTLEDKLGDWLQGIESNIRFLYEKDLTSYHNEAGKEVFEKHCKMLNLASIQGVSLHNSILLVDEFQLLDRDMLKMVLSRIASGSKVVLMGDTEGQTYGVNRSREGFRTLYKSLGQHKAMSYIKLDKIYRGELTEFVEEVFK